MHNFRLTNKEIKNLRIAHKKAKEKKYAYRIHAVILLGQEWNYSEVSDVLFTNRDTLRNYVVRYQKLGINGLLKDQYHGRSSQLTTNEIKLLDQHLQEVVYMRAKDIIEYVALEFDVRYSESGMTQLLHTLDYSYKKPKKVPGKANAEEQAKFICAGGRRRTPQIDPLRCKIGAINTPAELHNGANPGLYRHVTYDGAQNFQGQLEHFSLILQTMLRSITDQLEKTHQPQAEFMQRAA